LKFYYQRFNNDNNQELSDVEIMTINFFCVHEEKRFKPKHIHKLAGEYLHSRLPSLGSYEVFNYRLNRLTEALRRLVAYLFEDSMPQPYIWIRVYLIQSLS